MLKPAVIALTIAAATCLPARAANLPSYPFIHVNAFPALRV